MKNFGIVGLLTISLMQAVNAAEIEEWRCSVVSGGSGTVNLVLRPGSLEVKTPGIFMGQHYAVTSDTGLIVIATGTIATGVEAKWTLDRGMGTLRVAIGTVPQIREAKCTRQYR